MTHLINYLGSNQVLMNSPIFIGLALVIILRVTTTHGQRIWKKLWKYSKSGITMWVLYIILGFMWKTYFPTVNLYFGREVIMGWLSTGLNIYLMYLAYEFLRRSNKSIQLLWVIVPFALTLLPNLIKLV